MLKINELTDALEIPWFDYISVKLNFGSWEK